MKKSIMILAVLLVAGSMCHMYKAVAAEVSPTGEIPVIKLTASDEELHKEIFERYDFAKNNCQELHKLITDKKMGEVTSISMSNNWEYLRFYIVLLETRYLNEKFKNEQTADSLQKLDVSKALLVKTMQEARLM